MTTHTYRSVNGVTVSSGGGGGGGGSPFVRSFDSTTSWGAPSGGFYSIVIPQSQHQKGLNPIVQVYELIGLDFEEVLVDTIQVNSFGDITILVTENVDTRFAGKAVIR